MHKETSEWSIRMLADFKGRINVDAEYQRGNVWSQAQQALLIDSIIRGFDIPKIYLRKLPDGSQYLFDVIDGKQRLTAIWRFVADDFRLLKSSVRFSGLDDLGGKRWSELPDSAKDRLQFANITVSKIENATDEEIRELFLRLQRGEPLKAAEKRNAISGPVRDFVADTLAAHPVWGKTGIGERRFGWHEHAAIILALVLAKGPTGLKGADLQQLYERNDFDPSGSSASLAIELLNTLEQIADGSPGDIKTRWGIVDLSLALMRFREQNRTVAPDKIMEFFQSFEKERQQVSQTLSDLQTRVVEFSDDDYPPPDEPEPSQIPTDMLRYHMAFAREGASKENVETRSEIMYRKMFGFLESQPGAK